jgi:uncharacterized membrane protein
VETAGGSHLRNEHRFVPAAVSVRTRSQVSQGVDQPDIPTSPSDPGWTVPAVRGGLQARRQGGSHVSTTHHEARKLAQDGQQIPVAVRE